MTRRPPESTLFPDTTLFRSEREYDLELMATMPSVEFEVTLTDGDVIPVHNPTDMPDPARIAEVREPYIRASILAPKEDRKSTRLNSSHANISYAVFCLKKKL